MTTAYLVPARGPGPLSGAPVLHSLCASIKPFATALSSSCNALSQTHMLRAQSALDLPREASLTTRSEAALQAPSRVCSSSCTALAEMILIGVVCALPLPGKLRESHHLVCHVRCSVPTFNSLLHRAPKKLYLGHTPESFQ